MNEEPKLRKTEEKDVEVFFYHQLDEEAAYMAAFTSKEHTDKEAYVLKWKRLLQDPSVNMRTVMLGDEIAGTVAKFEMKGNAEITYALDKKFWGQGIATRALTAFLPLEEKRPIFGVAAFDNIASIRVLEKCGFKRIGTDKGFANARGEEIEEVIFRLD